MKTRSIVVASCLLLLSIITSCKKDNSTSPSDNSIQQGQWKITSYIDSGNNETNHFSGYSFEFKNGGVVTATKSSSIVSGNWSTGTDDSQSKLYLTFSLMYLYKKLYWLSRIHPLYLAYYKWHIHNLLEYRFLSSFQHFAKFQLLQK